MSEYRWPDWGDYREREAAAARVWAGTVEALPVGTQVCGEVIGRQPFGVFLRIDHHPAAIGLAEITAMPVGEELPAIGERVAGRVLGHADHSHQVKIRLDGWTDRGDPE